ncbi:MAG: hypothetical protein P1U74_03270 [Legionellaceae bacterium]|nr:hypothetical protein [Legionellaceae bacterium]
MRLQNIRPDLVISFRHKVNIGYVLDKTTRPVDVDGMLSNIYCVLLVGEVLPECISKISKSISLVIVEPSVSMEMISSIPSHVIEVVIDSPYALTREKMTSLKNTGFLVTISSTPDDFIGKLAEDKLEKDSVGSELRLSDLSTSEEIDFDRTYYADSARYLPTTGIFSPNIPAKYVYGKSGKRLIVDELDPGYSKINHSDKRIKTDNYDSCVRDDENISLTKGGF